MRKAKTPVVKGLARHRTLQPGGLPTRYPLRVALFPPVGDRRVGKRHGVTTAAEPAVAVECLPHGARCLLPICFPPIRRQPHTHHDRFMSIVGYISASVLFAFLPFASPAAGARSHRARPLCGLMTDLSGNWQPKGQL